MIENGPESGAVTIRWWRSLRVRILLAYSLLILLTFGGFLLIVGQQISRGASEDFDANMEVQARLVAQGLEDVVAEYQDGTRSLDMVDTAVSGYASQLNMRLTLLDVFGSAWLDSRNTIPRTNQRTAPEIVAALNNRVLHDVRPNNSGEMIVHTAAPMFNDGRIIGIVRLTVSASAAENLVQQRWLALLTGALTLMSVAVIASLLLSRSLTRPLNQLRQSALQLASGDFSHRVVASDQDEIGQVARTFNYMAGRVEAMLNDQRAFASNASHELRTPLTTIRLRTEALLNDRLDPEIASRYIQEIDAEATRLSHLVNDLIMLSRLDNKRILLGEEPVDVVHLAGRLLAELETAVSSRQITLHLDIDQPLPIVHASPNHIWIVYHNLLGNAVKYTPPGGQIWWWLWADETAVYCEIEDTGPGVAAEDLPHLFERFYRADKARTREAPGVGLGLPLAQSIVTFYGGSISITSDGLGQGTTAHVEWPIGAKPENGRI